MEKFSVTLLPGLLRLYKCTRAEFENIIRHRFYDVIKDILCQTILDNEITIFLHIRGDNEATRVVFQSICVTDPRSYYAIDIHEDIPGIDHIGIIYQISKRFVDKEIPILYINTYGHNLILVSDEYIVKAMEILKVIAHV
jgi:ACT domain